MVQLLWEKVWQNLRLNLHLHYYLAIPLLDIYLPQGENLCQQKGLYKNFYGSSIHNNTKLETTQVSINKKMNKQIVVYSHNEILLVIKE